MSCYSLLSLSTTKVNYKVPKLYKKSAKSLQKNAEDNFPKFHLLGQIDSG